MPHGGLLTREQSEVEVERGNSLDTKVWNSQYGLKCSQTVALFEGSILVLTEEGLMMMNHLSWLRSI